jgi:L-glyceraldehyde 3-phosphate reductase
MNYKFSENRYDRIPYNRCGKSGLLLPGLSLGLWHNFGHVDDFDTLKSILTFAFDEGITHFDLANNYGPPPGSAETNFGKVLNETFKGHRDELIISTKAGYRMWPGPYGEWGSRKYLVSSLDQSLRRMQIDYVDIFYSHRPDPDTPLEETMSALDHIVRQGKALYVGISNYDAEQTRQASDILDSLGTPCLIHQPRYSMLDRWVENGLLDVLEEKGIGCIPFSPLAQGMLTNKYLRGIPLNSRVAKEWGFLKKEHLTRDKLSMIKALNEIADSRGQTLAQMALAWILKDNRITSVLVGASSVDQLRDNLKLFNNRSFSPEELDKIENILNH